MKFRLVVLCSLILRPEDSINFLPDYMSSHPRWQYCAKRFILKAGCKTREFENYLTSEFRHVNNNQEDNRKTERSIISTIITFNNSSMSTHFFFEALSLNMEYSTCGIWRGSKTTQSVLRWRWCLSLSKLHKHLAAVRGQRTNNTSRHTWHHK